MTHLNHGLVVGDNVSYGFNGDWYPDGQVQRFSKSGRFMFTTTGHKYVLHITITRDSRVERYRSIGGTWVIAKGVHNERNSHF